MRIRIWACVLALSIGAPQILSAQHEGHNAGIAAHTLVSGTVVCADGPVLPGAIVQVFPGAPSTKPVASALSDQNGSFSLSVAPGDYRLKISYLGHTVHEHGIAAMGTRLVLGKMTMEILALEMDAITAAAHRERTQLQGTTTVTNVADLPATAGGSVIDALRAVPGLEVTPDGNIAIRGSDKVTVLINGRRTALKDEALAAFIRQMPASALKVVEVAGSADAARAADGSAGVVNLIFNQERPGAGREYSAALSAATADQYSASTWLRKRAGRFDINVAYAASSMRPHTTSHTQRTTDFNSAAAVSHQLSRADAQHRLHSLSGEGAAQLNAQNDVSARLWYSWMRGAFDNKTTFADTTPTAMANSATWSTLLHTIPTLEAAAEWNVRSKQPAGMAMRTELRTSLGRERFAGSYAHPDEAPYLATAMESERRETAITSTLSFASAGIHFDMGGRYQIRTVEAAYSRNAAPSDSFVFDEPTEMLYLQASRITAGVFVQPSVRLERATTTRTISGDHSARDRNVQVLPSLTIHWPHDGDAGTRYQLSLSRRIDRPGSASLNPYSMGEDDMNASIGNPYLKPEVSTSAEFGIERHGAAVTLVATPFWRRTENAIRPIKAVTESGRSTTTLENIPWLTTAGVDASAMTRITPRIAAMWSGSVFYMASVNNSGVYSRAAATIDLRLADNTTAQVYGYRRNPQPVEQGEILGAFGSDVGVTHKFGAAQQGRLSLRVSDPFNTSKLSFHLADAAFVQHSERKVTSRVISVALSWALGSQPAEQPKTQPDKPEIF